MSKVLIGIAVVTTGLAFALSASAGPTTAQPTGSAKQDSHAFDNRSQLLEMSPEIMELESPTKFPLMLPQPTKIDGQNKYDLADSVRHNHS